MNSVEYLAGSSVVSSAPLAAYSDEALAFLSDLSKELLRERHTRAYPMWYLSRSGAGRGTCKSCRRPVLTGGSGWDED